MRRDAKRSAQTDAAHSHAAQDAGAGAGPNTTGRTSRYGRLAAPSARLRSGTGRCISGIVCAAFDPLRPLLNFS